MLFVLALPRALAAPTTYGPTGLIDMPTADVMRTDQLELGYYYLNKKRYEVFAVPLIKNVEFSGAIRDEKNQRTLKAVNIKYNFQQEGIIKPGLAIGVDDLGHSKSRDAYVVASKTLPFGIRLHAGTGEHKYRHGFIGASIELARGYKGGVFPDTKLMIEHIDKKTSYGIRMATAKGLQVSAGWRNHEPFWGITYTVP